VLLCDVPIVVRPSEHLLGRRRAAVSVVSATDPTRYIEGLKVEVNKDGRSWRIGTASDVAWISDRPSGVSVATAIPLVFKAYGTFHKPAHATEDAHERAVVDVLRQNTAEQPWWLGYLDTGAHDVVFPSAPRVTLYWDWRYVVVEAGPAEALRWRTGHMRGGMHGSLPDLFFPVDRSWLVSGLWDDTWNCVGGSEALIDGSPTGVEDTSGEEVVAVAPAVAPGRASPSAPHPTTSSSTAATHAEPILIAAPQPSRRTCSISATRNASSSDWPVFSRGSQAVS
jgi:hypothetical protein